MRINRNEMTIVTVGAERDPAAALGIIEIPALQQMQNQYAAAVQVALAYGAVVELMNPDHFGILGMDAVGSMETGYTITTTTVVNGKATDSTVKRNTATAALQTMMAFARNSNPFDFRVI